MRRLPLCAFCGGSLTRKDRMLVQLDSLPSRPIVGWHLDVSLYGSCYERDDLTIRAGMTPGEKTARIEGIVHRGGARVVQGATMRLT